MPSKDKSTRVDKAYARLKADILAGRLPPGFQAPEPDIAGRLGMSRTPVREALIRLEAERLVDLIPRRGAKVLAISKKDICEVFEILSALEALAAGSAAKGECSDRVLAGIEEAVISAEKALAEADMESWAMLDDRFHRLIARSGGNVRLDEMISSLLNQVFRANIVLLRLNKGPAANSDEHRELYDAIRAGDQDKAAAIAKAHRLAGLATMHSVLEACGLTHV
ncbi:GntR family transcriptional regulator [uncultured Roseibium sp.]|uniref:GntR family transcriptional regulator n=1 Tax=uncultured Roseibium sp. TaxID=1936171 RepID=UPI002631B3E2|nr:GntR family transcriptional regulator [uncultured Roseibium sp.]